MTDTEEQAGPVNREELGRFVSRIERLQGERDTITEDLSQVYAEARDAGFSVPILREIVREKRMEDDARNSRYALLEAYRGALGMLSDTPLGEAAMRRAESDGGDDDPPKRRGRRRRKEHDAAMAEEAQGTA